METIKSYGIRAAAERLGIQPTALIRLLVSLGWISKGNHARATSQAIASSNMIQLNGINADGMFSQARITEQGIATLKDQIAQQREGIAALRAMIEKCKKGFLKEKRYNNTSYWMINTRKEYLKRPIMLQATPYLYITTVKIY